MAQATHLAEELIVQLDTGALPTLGNAAFLLNVGRAVTALGNYTDASTFLSRALTMCETLTATSAPGVAPSGIDDMTPGKLMGRVHHGLGDLATVQGDFDRAITSLTTGLDYQKTLLGDKHMDVANTEVLLVN